MSVPAPLVSPEWLSDHLHDPSLRILDATVWLRMDPEGGPPSIESGRSAWEQGHIAGAGFADLLNELSDPEAPLPLTIPSAERFADGMSRLGVGPGVHVIAYDAEIGEWAARLWWMLRVFGFETVSVLDGGMKAWNAACLPVNTETPTPPPARFEAHPRPELLATRAEIQALLGDGATCLLNALPAALFNGERQIIPGRGGRIPGSVNVSYRDLVDPETNRFAASERLRERFAAAGTLETDRRVVSYCGGGIAATLDALALAVLGREDVAVYDGSLVEWASDPELPLETG